MNEKQEDLDRLKRAVADLGEYFDTVHIFATRHESGTEDGTISISYGCGNWFARYGKVREWLVREEEWAKIEVRKKDRNDEA